MCGIVGEGGALAQDLERLIHRVCMNTNRGHDAVGLTSRMKDQLRLPRYSHWGTAREACTEDRRTFRLFAREALEYGANGFLAHMRYPTVGPSDTDLIQPFPARHPKWGPMMLAHNGQIADHVERRRQCEASGHVFRTESDSEVLTATVASFPGSDLVDAVEGVVRNIPGSYSFLCMNHDYLVAARDRFGIRPLWSSISDGHCAFASEAASVSDNGLPREVNPGSVVWYSFADNTWGSRQVVEPQWAHCLLEAEYFSRPDQRLGDGIVADLRNGMGEALAEESAVEADMVCYVPDSGLDAGNAFARASGLPFQPRGIVRNFYAVPGKTFILPGQPVRHKAARLKYAVSPTVKGKRVIVVDDTIVRSTTMDVLVKWFLQQGAKEVHIRVAASPIVATCNTGIDIPNEEDLPAARQSVATICKNIGATSLQYLSYDRMLAVAEKFHHGWCTKCFGGPCPLSDCPKQLYRLQ